VRLLREVGFHDVAVGPPVDTFGGAPGEANARAFDVRGHPFVAHQPATADVPTGTAAGAHT
jgi:hypothetical protein